jgi:hypothetical protein
MFRTQVSKVQGSIRAAVLVVPFLAGSVALAPSAQAVEAAPSAAEMAAAVAAQPDGHGSGGHACGTSLTSKSQTITVWYRHCTSGSDSVRRKAIIAWGDDGNCHTIAAGQTRWMKTYTAPLSWFDRMVAC